jgi:hypothetical protein
MVTLASGPFCRQSESWLENRGLAPTRSPERCVTLLSENLNRAHFCAWFKTGAIRVILWMDGEPEKGGSSEWLKMAHFWEVFRAISLVPEAIRNGTFPDGPG